MTRADLILDLYKLEYQLQNTGKSEEKRIAEIFDTASDEDFIKRDLYWNYEAPVMKKGFPRLCKFFRRYCKKRFGEDFVFPHDPKSEWVHEEELKEQIIKEVHEQMIKETIQCITERLSGVAAE